MCSVSPLQMAGVAPSPRRLARLVLALAVTVPATSWSAAPEYRESACSRGFAGVPHEVVCGTLVVDETRGSGNGRRVAMPVVVVKAARPRQGAVPVIYLHGGPGGGIVSVLGRTLRSAQGTELVGQDQDWIFLDQRGGALSAPALDCGTSLPLNDAGPLSDAAAEAAVACAARHAAAGVDLSAYNAVEVARDIEDLRLALRLDRFDLFGVSYGTRIAFSVLRTQSTAVRAVVLDSVWPPEATWAEGGPKMIADAAHLVFSRCASDRDCRSAFPRAEAELVAVAKRLLSGPITVRGRTYHADDLGGFLMDTLYDADGARALPRDAHAFARNDFSAIDAHMADRSSYVEAQHLAHLCKEEFAFERRANVAGGVEDDPVGLVSVRSFQRYFDVCAGFPVGAPDVAESRPVSSAVPTLFLGAEFDPGCPPPIARAAAARFANGQFVLVPNTTHGVSRNSPCARRMIRAFLANPTRPVDQSCLIGAPKGFGFTLK
jgi:pimeloyl-ACP methyl ester carboxylesterase